MEQNYHILLVLTLSLLLFTACIVETPEQSPKPSSTTSSSSISTTSTTSTSTAYTTTIYYITTTTTSTTTTSTTTTSTTTTSTTTFPTTTSPPTTLLECRDTDGGMEYHIHGTVIHKDGRVVNDICEGDMLREYYCRKGEIKSIYYNCRYGCQDGICLDK
ncbi:MAG: hypothetical protein U9M95_06325 [Candidatus Altiarchaeota archaeon]|nr:hypothetical protein [Candidatus Altiarchaeota archaeon]